MENLYFCMNKVGSYKIRDDDVWIYKNTPSMILANAM